jgi:outer membrane protein W
LISLSSFSQEDVIESKNSESFVPGDGVSPFSLEVSLGQTFGGGNSLVRAPGIKFRYFFNSKMALRAGLGFSSYMNEDSFSENNDGSGEIGTYTIKYSGFNIRPGFEYHFASTNRLSPYVALDISVGIGSRKVEGINAGFYSYEPNYSYNSKNKSILFGTSINAGIDFYVAKNLFIGVEFGYAAIWSKDKEGTWDQNSNGNVSNGTTPEERRTNTGFGAFGGIRFGWRF